MGRPSGKDQPLTVKPMLCRMGIRGLSKFQRVGGSELGFPSGDEGGVIVEVTGGGEGSATSRAGERFRLGENRGEVPWDFLT